MVLHHEGFPIRKSAGHSLFPTHRSLSQVIASFIGSQCQGIHLTLFFAWTAVLLFSPFCLTEIWNKSSFYCLSFANNCILWVVRSKKTMIFRSYFVFVRLKISLEADEIVPTSFVRKNLYVSITSFSQLQLSVSFLFLYSVFNEHVPFHSSLLPFTYFHKR